MWAGACSRPCGPSKPPIIDSIPLPERDGNWVQKFRSTEDGSLFVGSQFFRYQEVELFIQENFESGNPLPQNGGDS